MVPFTYIILPLQYNSYCTTLPEWIALLTLCLAPLIAHIASGTPPVSYLAHSRPKWYDQLCHFNPTSILWRYAAITDRRIRAKSWSRNDLAASNAIFWTSNGWHGGEDMVVNAAPHCVKCPNKTHVEILSVTMLKTIITTLQGVSAIYSLIGSLVGLVGIVFIELMGVDTIFFPLALLGLLRLCAAAWLAEDFEYALQKDSSDKLLSPGLVTPKNNYHEIPLMDPRDPMDPLLISPSQSEHRFTLPNRSWPSRFFRVFYLLIVGGVWAMAFVFLMPALRGPWIMFTTTDFLVSLFFFFFLSVSLLLYAFYFFRNQTTTTLLPCISSTWYKIYTQLIMGFMVVIIVVASIETNRLPDGRYSSKRAGIELQCNERKNLWAVQPNGTVFGFASREELDFQSLNANYSSVAVAEISGNRSLSENSYWLYNFTGYCSGRIDNMDTR